MNSRLIIQKDHRSMAMTDIRIIPMVTTLIMATVLRSSLDSALAMNTMRYLDTDMDHLDTDRLVTREAVIEGPVIQEAVIQKADTREVVTQGADGDKSALVSRKISGWHSRLFPVTDQNYRTAVKLDSLNGCARLLNSIGA